MSHAYESCSLHMMQILYLHDPTVDYNHGTKLFHESIQGLKACVSAPKVGFSYNFLGRWHLEFN